MERMEPAAAPSGEVEGNGVDGPLICPWCDGEDVEKISEYGPHLMVYSFMCRECNSPFEVIKR